MQIFYFTMVYWLILLVMSTFLFFGSLEGKVPLSQVGVLDF